MADDSAKATSHLWRFNPLTRRHVLRSGTTWAKLVKEGTVEDAELQETWNRRMDASHAKRVATLREARALGFRAVPRAPKYVVAPEPEPVASDADDDEDEADADDEPEAKAPEPEADSVNIRLMRLAIENKAVLGARGLGRVTAEDVLRRAYQQRYS